MTPNLEGVSYGFLIEKQGKVKAQPGLQKISASRLFLFINKGNDNLEFEECPQNLDF